jgi:hypothetical protein
MVDLKRKTALIWDNGLFAEFAVTLAKDFGRVLYFSSWVNGYPKSNAKMIGFGIPKVERVDEPWSHLDEVDLFVFPDVYEGGLQEYLVSQGKRVWGCRGGDWLELDRPRSKEASRKLGIDVGPYKEIEGLDALRKHLKAHDDQYVKINSTRGDMETFHSPNYENAEPVLDHLEHTLGAKKKIMTFIVEQGINDAIEVGYDGFTIDGKFANGAIVGVEVKDKAYLGKTMTYGRLPENVRSVNDKLAPELKSCGYRGFISTEIRSNKDGDFLIDPCCFADDTEVLTDQGWKLFQDLDHSEGIATLNVESGETEYQYPTDFVSYRYTGEMVLISNKEKGIECLVTPNHGVWRTDRRGNVLFRERADSLSDKGYIPRTGKWIGENVESYIVPPYYSRWVSGKGVGVVREHIAEALSVPIKDWLRFLAIYLGDGSVHSDWSLNIAQTDESDKKEAVAAILDALPFKSSRNARGFVVNSVQLTEHMRDTGLCNEKRIPDYVKGLSAELIATFLDAYRLCDGGEHKGQKLYYTTSKGLADDLQELIFKAGRLANIRKREVAGTTMTVGDKTYTRNHDTYVVAEVGAQTRFWFETGSRADRYISRVPYDGMVHDVTVPNGTVYVRRNGKPFWSSNCRAGSPPSELYQNMIGNLAEVLWYGAEGIVIEPEYVAKWGAEVLLHSSWADQNWQQVRFPKSVRDNIKLRNFCVIDGEYYVIPQWSGMPEIGAVVAMGDTAQQAIDECKRIAKLVEGHNIEVPDEALDEAYKDLKATLKTADVPPSPLERRAEAMKAKGLISAKQLERMLEKE